MNERGNDSDSLPPLPAGPTPHGPVTAVGGSPAQHISPDRARSETPTEAGEFEDFFTAHYRTLFKLIRYLGADHGEAEEAVARTMTEVFISWHRLEDPLAWSKKADKQPIRSSPGS